MGIAIRHRTGEGAQCGRKGGGGGWYRREFLSSQVPERACADGVQVSGMYAAGWAARGPVGVIASTMHDAYSLSSLILEDHFATPPPASVASPLNTMPEAGLPEEVEVARKQGSVVDLAGWGRIDEAERERARRRGGGKEREKFTTVREMLAVLA